MQLGLVVGRQHHLFQWATSSGTELTSLAVWCAIQFHFWWLYLISSVKPCDRVTNATAQQIKSGKKLLCSSPVHIPLASRHTLICLRALPVVWHYTAHTASISERKAFWSPAACVYFPSQIRTLTSSKRGGMSGTFAVTIWQKHHSIFWQLNQGFKTIISVPDSSAGDRRSSCISLQPSTLIQFSLSQLCWNFTLPH